MADVAFWVAVIVLVVLAWGGLISFANQISVWRIRRQMRRSK